MLHANKRWVFKYPLPNLLTVGTHLIETNKDARVLLVGHQDHVPTVWMDVSMNKETERHLFVIYGTGSKVDDNDIPVGSYIDGDFVWHIYESNP